MARRASRFSGNRGMGAGSDVTGQDGLGLRTLSSQSDRLPGWLRAATWAMVAAGTRGGRLGAPRKLHNDRTRMIATERLDLVPATVELTRAALDGEPALAARLGVIVPATWPPEFLDPSALEFTLDRLAESAQQAGWWLHFVVLARGATGRTLIGSAGYKGPPSPDGTVEVGYGIVRDHQRQGYASEAVRGLLERAFAVPAVQRVIAETLPELTPSIGVLRKCGFRLTGDGSEPGVIRFELTRAEFSIGKGAA
jgi:[ribosomal protein S5]-alanine N-acetyltransferase